jgi:hypothetical protein
MSQAKSYLSISALEFLTGDPIRRVGGMHLVPCEFEPFQSDGGAERSDAAPARWRRPFLAVARRNRKRMGDLRVDCGVRRGLDAVSDDRLSEWRPASGRAGNLVSRPKFAWCNPKHPPLNVRATAPDAISFDFVVTDHLWGYPERRPELVRLWFRLARRKRQRRRCRRLSSPVAPNPTSNGARPPRK